MGHAASVSSGVSGGHVGGASHQTSEGITISIAREGDDLTYFRRLVFDEYSARGWISDGEFPDGIVTDIFDEASDALVIKSGGEVIAGTRIVRDGGVGFPHEGELRIDHHVKTAEPGDTTIELLKNTPRSKMAEITKLVGKKKVRSLSLDLYAALYHFALIRGIELYVMVIDLEFFMLCDHYGIPIRPIGRPTFCEGSWTIPAITLPAEWPGAISGKSPEKWDRISNGARFDHTWTIH